MVVQSGPFEGEVVAGYHLVPIFVGSPGLRSVGAGHDSCGPRGRMWLPRPLRASPAHTRGAFGPIVCATLTLVACAQAVPAYCASDADCPSTVPRCGCDERCGLIERPTVTAVFSRAFVVAGISVAPGGEPAQAYGLDLDHQIDGPADACDGTSDFVSPVSSARGVDNAIAADLVNGYDLATFLGEPDGFEALFADAIERGEGLLVLEIADDEDTVLTCGRGVHLWVAHTIDGAVPEPSHACATRFDRASCAEAVDPCVWRESRRACTGIAPGPRVVPVTDLGVVGGATIDGRLHVGPIPRLPLPLRVRDVAAPLDAGDAFLTGDFDGRDLTRIELGARIPFDRLLDWSIAFVDPRTDASFLELVVPPDLRTGSDATGCSAVSVGLALRTIDATLVH